MKKIVLTLSTLLCFPAVAEVVQYSKERKSLQISSRDRTVFLLPSPPLSIGCQPSNVVTFSSPGDLASVEDTLPPSKKNDFSSYKKGSNYSTKGQEYLLASTIVVNPVKPSGTAACSMYLANQDKIDLKILLRSDVFRPLVKFESDQGVLPLERYQESRFEMLDLMRLLLVGQKPANTTKIESEIGFKLTSEVAEYQFIYSGENNVGKVFIVSGIGKKDFTLKRFLYQGNPKVSPIRYSAISSGDQKDPFTISQGESFRIFIAADKGTLPNDIRKAFQ